MNTLLAKYNINILGITVDLPDENVIPSKRYIVVFEYQWQKRGRYSQYNKATWSKDFIRTQNLETLQSTLIERVQELRSELEDGVED